MKYEKAVAEVELFDTDDIITTSTEDCGFEQFDAEACDGVYQAVSKGQF